MHIYGRRPGGFWRIGLSPILQKKTPSLRELCVSNESWFGWDEWAVNKGLRDPICCMP